MFWPPIITSPVMLALPPTLIFFTTPIPPGVVIAPVVVEVDSVAKLPVIAPDTSNDTAVVPTGPISTVLGLFAGSIVINPPFNFNSVIADVLTPALVTVKISLDAVSYATLRDIKCPTDVKLLPVRVDASDEPEIKGWPPINKLPSELIDVVVKLPLASTLKPGLLNPEAEVSGFCITLIRLPSLIHYTKLTHAPFS